MVFALASYAVSEAIAVSTLALAISSWTSTIIRYAHTSLPSFVGMGAVYKRIRPKYLTAILIILTVAGSTQVPLFTQAMQRSLQRVGEPINRLSFDYRAPYYRLYLIAKTSGKTLVVGGIQMRGIQTYMSMLPNVLLIGVPSSEAEFRALINQTWNTIYLYDDWYTVQDPSIAGVYPPYYWAILHSQSYHDFTVQPLWTDSESYAFQLVKSS